MTALVVVAGILAYLLIAGGVLKVFRRMDQQMDSEDEVNATIAACFWPVTVPLIVLIACAAGAYRLVAFIGGSRGAL